MPDQWTTSDLFEEPEVKTMHLLTPEQLDELLAEERNKGYDEGFAEGCNEGYKDGRRDGVAFGPAASD